MILIVKAKRAMSANKKAYFACIFLIMTGILMYTALSIAAAGLEASALSFYRVNRLADTYGYVQSMPVSYTDTLRKIPGIAAVQSRYVTELRAEVPGAADTITLKLIASDPADETPLNLLNIEGRANTDKSELLVNPAFMQAHKLRAGDEILVISQGREFSMTVTGTAISPEYVYIVKNTSQMLPDEAGYGIAYITAEGMAMLTGHEGVANSIVLEREPGVTFDQVRTGLEDQLRPYGLKELYDKEDLMSYFFLELEMSSIAAMSTSLPMVFLFLAIVVLYLMLKRVIEQERTQIGTLKAFGYSNRRLIGHYLGYGMVTGITGGILGWVLGYLLSRVYLEMFLQFFMLPRLAGGFDPGGIVRALSLSAGSGLLGAYAGVRSIIRLHPAEAMRAESPRSFRFDIINYIGIFRQFLSSRGNMSLRSISRNPVRSLFVVISIMFSFGIISLVGSFNGLIDKMIFAQLQDIQRYQVKLSLEQPLHYRQAVEEAWQLDSVSYAEGLLELPFRISSRHLHRDIVLTGVPDHSVLYHIADTNTGETYPPPTGSIILSNGLAGELQVRAGDRIMLSSNLLPDDTELTVSAVIEQNMGSGSYTGLGFLSELTGHPEMANAIILNTDDVGALKESVKSSSVITTIEDKEKTLSGYRAMMGMFTGVYAALELLGTLVAFAIIYNTATISLSERKREYATLRVLGLSVGEVAGIMNFEYAVLTVCGIVLGIPFTRLLNHAVNMMMDTDLFCMPSTLPVSAYLLGVSSCVLAIVFSGRSATGKIRRFDMVEVLKERE